jgi:hypothetical protein
MNFPKDLVPGVQSEDTTRARSFLFIALGVFAGSGCEPPFMLRVPENGLIAINVPLDPLRLGSLSTRTTHPFYLARWNELLGLLGLRGQIENPYWDKTKGEMIRGIADKRLIRTLLPTSMSCSSPTKGRWRGLAAGHCGHCVPCLIRRAAIEAALGLGNDPTSYTLADLRSHPLDSSQAEGREVRSFQLAIERLRTKPSLAKLLIHKPGPLNDEKERLDRWAEVYRRGLEEVGQLLSGVRARPT